MNTKYKRNKKYNDIIITYLNHMKLINKCISRDVYGNIPYEIHKLEESIMNDTNIKIETKALALSLCNSACTNIISRNSEKVLSCIYSLNQMAMQSAVYSLEEDTVNRNNSKISLSA